MEIKYRNATIDDIDFLVKSRLDFIHILDTDKDYDIVKSNLYRYFSNGLKENQCDVILAEDNNSVIGTGIIFYYDAVPSMFNHSGKNAYITSIFVNEEYRRQGIASAIVNRLIEIAHKKEHYIIVLHETKMGRPLYRKFGFKEGKKGMILKVVGDENNI